LGAMLGATRPQNAPVKGSQRPVFDPSTEVRGGGGAYLSGNHGNRSTAPGKARVIAPRGLPNRCPPPGNRGQPFNCKAALALPVGPGPPLFNSCVSPRTKLRYFWHLAAL